MKKNLFISLLIYISFTITAIGCTYNHNTKSQQDIKKETREFAAFTKISLSVPADLILVQGGPQKVELEGSAADLENIITELDDNTLKIKKKDEWFPKKMDKVKIYITMANIEKLAVAGSGSIIASTAIKSDHLSLAVSGSGDIKSENEIVSEDLKLVVSGSGDIDLNNVAANSINSTVTGSGDININGNKKVQKQNITITGSGEIKSEGLETQDVKVVITGSGSSRVFVTDNLDAAITGSGDLYYKGKATVNAKVTGSGKVRSI